MRRLTIAVVVLLGCVTAFASDPPQRPRIFGIARVELFTSDLRAANEFYSPVLGMMRPSNCPAGCDKLPPSRAFSVNGLQEIALSPMPSTPPVNLVKEITFATDDIDALRRYVEYHKIPVKLTDLSKTRARDQRPLTILDPEGHKISFVEWRKSTSELLPEYSKMYDIIHAGFVVRDRAAEDNFYQGVLGFHPYWHGGMKDDQTDWVSLQVPDGTDWIEFMVSVAPDADHHTLGVMNHIAIGVADIQKADKEISARWLKPHDAPKLGRDGKWQLNLYDPDDTRVEFMEFLPKEKPCCSEYTGQHPGSSGSASVPSKP